MSKRRAKCVKKQKRQGNWIFVFGLLVGFGLLMQKRLATEFGQIRRIV